MLSGFNFTKSCGKKVANHYRPNTLSSILIDVALMLVYPPPTFFYDHFAEYAAMGAGGIALPITFWTEYTMKIAGLGVNGVGKVEALSYFTVASIVLWSLYTKARTGQGLKRGPKGEEYM